MRNNCANCSYGNDGKINGTEHCCWKHYKETDFHAPESGCDEWEPIPKPVCCRDGCLLLHTDFGDRYTPPSAECVKSDDDFAALNIEPSVSEYDLNYDPEKIPDCPFYINADTVENLFWDMHIGERLIADDFCCMPADERTELEEHLAHCITPEWQKAHRDIMGFSSPLADLYETLGFYNEQEDDK